MKLDPIAFHVLETTADAGAQRCDTLHALDVAVAVSLHRLQLAIRKWGWQTAAWNRKWSKFSDAQVQVPTRENR